MKVTKLTELVQKQILNNSIYEISVDKKRRMITSKDHVLYIEHLQDWEWTIYSSVIDNYFSLQTDESRIMDDLNQLQEYIEAAMATIKSFALFFGILFKIEFFLNSISERHATSYSLKRVYAAMLSLTDLIVLMDKIRHEYPDLQYPQLIALQYANKEQIEELKETVLCEYLMTKGVNEAMKIVNKGANDE